MFRNDHMSLKDDWKFQLRHDNQLTAEGAVSFGPVPLNQSVRLTWTPVEGATGYKVRIGTQKGEYRSTFDAGALTAYKVTTLTNETTYYFAVVAYNEHGESKPSNERASVPEG